MSLKPDIIRGTELTLDMFLGALVSQVPATAHITCDGVTYAQPDLAKKVEEVRAPYKSVRTLKTELKKARLELEEKEGEIERFVHGLHTGIKAFLGEGSPEVVKFGFKEEKKRRPLTSEEAQERAKKAKLTRQARHTMGPRQKEEIKGVATPPPKTGV